MRREERYSSIWRARRLSWRRRQQGRRHADALAPRVAVIDHGRRDLAFRRVQRIRYRRKRVRKVGDAEADAEFAVQGYQLRVVP